MVDVGTEPTMVGRLFLIWSLMVGAGVSINIGVEVRLGLGLVQGLVGRLT